jgi:hypothetical protein
MESLLSSYQQHIIIRQMLHEARHLTKEGMPPPQVKASVAHLRDHLVEQALTDLRLRCKRGHLR